ncbi:two component transcriptional regulator, LytTR family [Filimonas lacunae]|uniref:Two component transcriptional regulator, LytTR family n=1 Tax=Filimonas lacunae TaxID=477680 RepID=A0A173MFZ8_9BACT|nr:response regulator [Filimonas lacunae]BAV06409.1 two-component transcriptional regulator [Filimonas lacunae]SIT26843.1 two component transcriptional regulator, LytTR family [Filimonas lacunae]
MKKITAIIIDDERSARNEIRRLAAGYPYLDIIAEARDAEEAERLIEEMQPDLLFLDIQMPGRSGFELLESLAWGQQVIFITAFDQYAVKAFEVSALDYLMKPVREERFAKAIEQVQQKFAPPGEASVFIKDRNRYYFLPWKEVFLIESMDNYARLSFDDKNVLVKSSLNQLEKRLEVMSFFRVNRAQLINTNFIRQIETLSDGRTQLTLTTGSSVEISERQWVKFKKSNRNI